MSDAEALTALDTDLWVATRGLPLWVGDVGTRMTVMRLGGGDLLLHSPVSLDPGLRAALDRLGRVRWVVGPSLVHHLFLADYAKAYPAAALWGAPGLAAKRPDLRFERTLAGAAVPEWEGRVHYARFEGAPRINELVFLHRPTRTLVLTDLAFNVQPGAKNRAKIFHWLVGAGGGFGPHRIIRAVIRDRAAARRSLAGILAWDFERIVVTHGDVLERGGREALRAGFAFLGPS
jgi:hypothetical protein